MKITLFLIACFLCGAFWLAICKAASRRPDVVSDGEGFDDWKWQPDRPEPELGRLLAIHKTLK